MAKTRLTTNDRKFVLLYAGSYDGAAAYREAFSYTGKNAKALAYRLLQNVIIQEALSKAVEEVLGPYEKDLTQNVKFWIKIRDDESARNADRIKASECLSRHRGFFTDKKEISGNMAVNIVDDI